jgi:hypothetical protein
MSAAFAPAVAEPRARQRDLIAAEWLKLWSLRSTGWALAVSALAVIAVSVVTAYDQYQAWPRYAAADRAAFVRDEMALQHAFTANAALLLLLTVSAVGALTVVGEYGSGLIRTTFAAVPARRSLLAAKMTVVVAVTTVFGALVSLASFVLTQALLDQRGAAVPIGDPDAPRLLVASALLAPLAALVGMALGAVLRHPATTLVVTFLVFLLLPLVFDEDRRWGAVLHHSLPFSAWNRLTQIDADQAAYPWTISGAWTVYAVWGLAAAVLVVATVHRRDQ